MQANNGSNWPPRDYNAMTLGVRVGRLHPSAAPPHAGEAAPSHGNKARNDLELNVVVGCVHCVEEEYHTSLPYLRDDAVCQCLEGRMKFAQTSLSPYVLRLLTRHLFFGFFSFLSGSIGSLLMVLARCD
jgi:hypothetical protein